MQYQIRRATEEDVPLLTPLFSGYREFYRREADPVAESRFLTDRLQRNESVIFLAVSQENGSGLGFTQLYPMFSSVRLRQIWILNDLFVAHEARSFGIASALMNAAEQFSRETNSAGLELATEKSNTSAQALYDKRAWEVDDDFLHYSLSHKE